VDALAQRGVTVFVAGDDDQSLYSFRYAAPSGIRRFPETYPGAGDHSLRHCFRCTPAVLNAAEALIASNAEPERIPKAHVSMYDNADPRVGGGVGCWRFTNDEAEARAVAQSIHHLCAEGMPARQIMILLANANTLCRALLPALDDAGIAYEVPRTTPFKDTDVGRALMTALRLGVRDDDFVALRTLLALRRGVGVGTAAAIGDVVIASNLSYRDLFGDFDEDLVSGRQLAAIGAVRETVEQTREWGPDDELREHADQIEALLPDILNREPEAFWRDEFTELPDETTLAEALQYLAAEKDEQRARVLAAIHKRLGNDVAVEELLPDAVRVMTMHGAKGLSAQMVFIPGLEQEILPGPKRLPYTGLVLEAARMLYVSITRARLGCNISYAEWRTTRAMPERRTPSSFTTHLGTTFTRREGGFSREVAHEAVAAATRL
jgi:ATP-dependent DNA helicase UvrD/PcrA